MIAERKFKGSNPAITPVLNSPTPSPVQFDKAKEAVEHWLGLGAFIELNKSGICKRLEEYDKLAAGAESNEGQGFFTQSLPLINSIIHVGSSRINLEMATERIKERWPDADPAFWLSALTFIYIVGKHEDLLGASLRSKKKRAVWDRICRHAEDLIN